MARLPPHQMIGETLGSYKIVSALGKGAMGEVFLAEHQHISRRAAIKVLIPQLTESDEVVHRFFVEARAMSLIQHPGIVEVFDCAVHTNGRAYIVMEYLEGETLAAALLREERLPGGGRARSPARSRRRSAPRTTRGSPTAISSPRTSSCAAIRTPPTAPR